MRQTCQRSCNHAAVCVAARLQAQHLQTLQTSEWGRCTSRQQLDMYGELREPRQRLQEANTVTLLLLLLLLCAAWWTTTQWYKHQGLQLRQGAEEPQSKLLLLLTKAKWLLLL
jgi:hypothetical protein